MNWRRSTYSGEGNCTEVAGHGGWVLVRDSKDSQGPILRFTPGAWRLFAEQVRGARSLASDSRPIL
jgi:hypothetical protein